MALRTELIVPQKIRHVNNAQMGRVKFCCYNILECELNTLHLQEINTSSTPAFCFAQVPHALTQILLQHHADAQTTHIQQHGHHTSMLQTGIAIHGCFREPPAVAHVAYDKIDSTSMITLNGGIMMVNNCTMGSCTRLAATVAMSRYLSASSNCSQPQHSPTSRYLSS